MPSHQFSPPQSLPLPLPLYHPFLTSISDSISAAFSILIFAASLFSDSKASHRVSYSTFAVINGSSVVAITVVISLTDPDKCYQIQAEGEGERGVGERAATRRSSSP
ncbi:hypothetical protein LOK49_LG06G02371 [Camellia lanceoleosa]|uniref:Uncharacterized protein n=1 Tax=Camellia lanceoleosa TaxID=1840588 RepID=A0ACC0HCK1_9ERIC|nr:hypothetical protein LOK49_LG06G02371 [Camellia lanceoleosa]